MSTPKVSVAMPTYNNAQFIDEALASVQAQRFQDFEVIVIDDGSRDDTRQRVERHGARVSYHYQENQGVAAARNAALRLARGEYVAWLDSDDVWEPEHLSAKVAVLDRFPGLGGVFGEFGVINPEGLRHERGTKFIFPFFQRTGSDFGDVFEEHHVLDVGDQQRIDVYVGDIFEKLFQGNFILPSSMVLRRQHVDAIGEFRTDLAMQEDYEYLLRFARRFRFAFVDRPQLKYRRHAQQLTDYSKIEQILTTVGRVIESYEEEFARRGQRRTFERRKADLLAGLAKVYVGQNKRTRARELFMAGIRRDPRRLENYLHLILSFVPHRLLAGVRSALSGRGAAS